MNQIASSSLVVVACFIFIGGLIGFLKGKSKASLIAGTVSGALLVVSYLVSTFNALAGYLGAFIILTVLDFVFIKRLIKTKVFMPAGLILLICMIEQLVLLYVFLNMSSVPQLSQ